MKRVMLLCAALLLALGPAAGAEDPPAAGAGAAAGEAQAAPTEGMTSHKVVLITDEALNPQRVTLDEGQLVAWISYSADESVVVFEREVARDMICHSLVNFSLQDSELRSAPIGAGEFASFCQLKPGSYEYKIVRPAAAAGHKQLEGEIVVGSPE